MKMNTTKMAPEFSISKQIELTDLAFANESGFKTILCLRPDDEEPDQISFSEIAAAAREYEIASFYVPVVPGQMASIHLKELAKIMTKAKNPVLAYCRSGKRAELLWQKFTALQIPLS
jgi:uncharacterized protein (TIGR01244 family)